MIGEMKKTTLILQTEAFSEAYSEEVEVEVLPKETICNILKDLDFSSLAHEAFDYARGYHGASGNVFVTLDLINGEISMSWRAANTIRIGYCNASIELLKIYTGEDDYHNTIEDIEYLLVEQEHLDYYYELKEVYDRYQQEEMLDMVIEKFNLDKEYLEKEYFKHIDIECLDFHLEEACIEEQIEYFYSKAKK